MSDGCIKSSKSWHKDS